MLRPSTATRRSRLTLGVQHAVVAIHPAPRSGGLITIAGRWSTTTSGPSISGRSIIAALGDPASSAYVTRLVTRSGAVPGARATSTLTPTAADAGTTADGFLSNSVCV